mmetsp:Transcript_70890/g.189280  ORF Transcript_70890/g.189280 Transcript_70890/m.189280 type:complete len:206 (-) Transcript_70890:146-763(-)
MFGRQGVWEMYWPDTNIQTNSLSPKSGCCTSAQCWSGRCIRICHFLWRGRRRVLRSSSRLLLGSAAKAAGAGFRQDTYGRRTGAPAIAAKLPTGGGASAGAAPALAGGHRGHLAHEHVRATRGAPLHRGVPRGGAVPDGYGGRRLYAGALRSLRRHQVGGPRVGALRSPPRQRAGPAHAAVHFGAGRRPAHRAGRGLRRRALRPH